MFDDRLEGNRPERVCSSPYLGRPVSDQERSGDVGRPQKLSNTGGQADSSSLILREAARGGAMDQERRADRDNTPTAEEIKAFHRRASERA